MDNISLEGKFVIKVYRKDKLIHAEKGTNLVVNTGLNLSAVRTFVGAGGGIVDYMAIGSGTNSPLAVDTTLQTEIPASRNAAVSATVVGSQATLSFTMTATAGWSMREMGLFDDPTAGTMFSRFLTQSVDLVLNDVITLTWVLQYTGA